MKIKINTWLFLVISLAYVALQGLIASVSIPALMTMNTTFAVATVYMIASQNVSINIHRQQKTQMKHGDWIRLKTLYDNGLRHYGDGKAMKKSQVLMG